jgi:hypothetical protein
VLSALGTLSTSLGSPSQLNQPPGGQLPKATAAAPLASRACLFLAAREPMPRTSR